MTQAPLIIYPHIGRTGGDYLSNMLRLALPDHRHKHYDLKELAWEDFRYMRSADFDHLKIVYGHGMYYGIHKYIERPCEYVSILRQPADRVLSQYYAYMSDPSYAIHNLYKEGKITLEDYIRTNSNNQTKHLLGYPAYLGNEINEWHIEEVLEFIDKTYVLLGVTEHWFEFMHVLAKKLEINELPLLGRTRENANRKSINEVGKDVLELIRENNQVDQALYELALTKNKRQLATLSNPEKIAIEVHQSRIKLVQKECANINFSLFDRLSIERMLFKGRVKIAIINCVDENELSIENIKELFTSLNRLSATNITTIYSETFEVKPKQILEINQATICKLKNECDYIIVTAKPAQDFIPKEALLRNNIDLNKICFLLRHIPHF